MGVRLILQAADGAISVDDRPADDIPNAIEPTADEKTLSAGVTWEISGNVATCSGSEAAMSAFGSINPVTMYLNGIATRNLVGGVWRWVMPDGSRVLSVERT